MATDRVISVTARAILTCWLTAKSFPFQAGSEFSHNRHAGDANHAAAWPFVHPRRGSTIDHFHELDSVTEGIGNVHSEITFQRLGLGNLDVALLEPTYQSPEIGHAHRYRT